MADARHLGLIEKGACAWNDWRRRNRRTVPDLTDASLGIAQKQWSAVNGEPINLRRAKLSGTDLCYATLIDADLQNADLTGANLSRARLVGANLCKADLSHVRFDGADVRDTRFDGSKLFHADLSTAINLDKKQLRKAHFDSTTQLPDFSATQKLASDTPTATPVSQLVAETAPRPRKVRLSFGGNVLEAFNGHQAASAGTRRFLNLSSTAFSLLPLVGLLIWAMWTPSLPVLQTDGSSEISGWSKPTTTTQRQAKNVFWKSSLAPSARNGVQDRNADQPEQRQAAIFAKEAWRRSRDDAAWDWATRAGTQKALQSYLDVHSDGRHITEARQRLATLKTEEAAKQAAEERERRAAEAAERRAVAEATRLAADDAAWDQAKRAGTQNALQSYLDAHSDGRHQPEAQQQLAALKNEDAAKQAAEERERRAAEEAERRAVAEATRLAADNTAWDQATRAGTQQALQSYLDVHSDGHHITEARQRLALIDPGALPLPERKPTEHRHQIEIRPQVAGIDAGQPPLPERKPAERPKQIDTGQQLAEIDAGELPLPKRKPDNSTVRRRPEPPAQARYAPYTRRLRAAVNNILSGGL